MKRIALAAGLVLVAAALAGVLRPEGASAVDPAADRGHRDRHAAPASSPPSPTARRSPPESSRARHRPRRPPGQRSGDAEGARRAAGARRQERDDADRLALDRVRRAGPPDGFVASNVASAETTLAGAGALIDAAVDAGANDDLRAVALALRRGGARTPGAREGSRRRDAIERRSSRRPPAGSSAASPRSPSPGRRTSPISPRRQSPADARRPSSRGRRRRPRR